MQTVCSLLSVIKLQIIEVKEKKDFLQRFQLMHVRTMVRPEYISFPIFQKEIEPHSFNQNKEDAQRP